MPPRFTWKGFIRLNLVTIPVKSYTATSSTDTIQFHQLHRECNSRIKYKKMCPQHGEMKKEDIISGYEYTRDQYVMVEPDELSNLYRQSDKAINIDCFVEPGTIDGIYFNGKTYYLVPDGPVGQKPYALLQRCLEDKGLIGMSRAVLYGREQLLLLRPLDGLLVCTMLSFPDAVRKPELFREDLGEVDLDEDELSLTSMLVEAKRSREFDFSSYKDDYNRKLTELIEAKVAGKEIVEPPPAEEPQVINLMEALKKSLAQADRKQEGKKAAKKEAAVKGKKKMAPSARGAAAKRKKKTG